MFARGIIRAMRPGARALSTVSVAGRRVVSLSCRSRAFSSVLHTETMPFGALKVDLDHPSTPDQRAFASSLTTSIQQWRDDNASAVWLDVPAAKSGMIAEAAKHGFGFHHAEGGRCMLNLWLKDGDSPIPPYATHKIGVAGFVKDQETGQVLVIKERNGSWNGWKLPGGLCDLVGQRPPVIAPSLPTASHFAVRSWPFVCPHKCNPTHPNHTTSPRPIG